MTRELAIDSQGRIELPKDIRELIGAEAGGHILIRTLDNGTILLEPQIDFRTLCGILPNNSIHLTTLQINEVISTMGVSNDRH